ncbi:methionine synthase reductase-like isoform X2 [Amphibalanus amphitrite]|uniref:methionine synthase reductase-like isoform X2 n=1 Tax=Amphibalanus amphitrite TaxID=1232801 RepID=UPI001C9015F6|nr:methionine synthase reductase-like isoform X2 [Amphibalanus amphitrite]
MVSSEGAGPVPAALTQLSEALAAVKLTVPPAPARFLRLEYLPEGPAGAAADSELARGPLPLADGPVCRAPVLRAERLTAPQALKTVWAVTLDGSGLGGEVDAGDTVGVLCPNSAEEVAQLLRLTGTEERADTPCRVTLIPETAKKAARVPAHLEAPDTPRRLLTHRLDVRAVPKKPLLQALPAHTADARQRRRLQELASRQGGAEYLRLVRAGGVGTLRLLAAFPSCRPPLELLLEQLPPLAPRPYSASSSPRLHPGRLRIVFSVVEEPARGLCTGWLDGLLRAAGPQPQEEPRSLTVPLYRRRPGQFRLPDTDAEAARPLLMVAAGTGLAPLAGMLQERRARRLAGPAWLVFGCRSREHDYLFRDELEAAQRDGALTRLDAVFSRAGGPQRYVQHVLSEESQRLARWLLEDRALLYVCGDARGMAAGVEEVVVEAVAQAKGVPLDEAKATVKQMQKDGQYKQDVWS